MDLKRVAEDLKQAEKEYAKMQEKLREIDRDFTRNEIRLKAAQNDVKKAEQQLEKEQAGLARLVQENEKIVAAKQETEGKLHVYQTKRDDIQKTLENLAANDNSSNMRRAA